MGANSGTAHYLRVTSGAEDSLTVALAEKTLEHWASQYILYRFRSQAAVWWPATGVDVDVQSLPHLPGKAVSLELKTTSYTRVKPDQHRVMVDLGQLWDYSNHPLCDQPFYAFPQPVWDGGLATVARKNGLHPSELAFSRNGRSSWWFAEWMVVMTTQEVAQVLKSKLMTHGSSTRGKKSLLVTFSVSAGRSTPEWASPRPPGWSPLGWKPFWDRVTACGGPTWPQRLVVERRYLEGGRTPTYAQAVEAMRLSAVAANPGEPESLVCLLLQNQNQNQYEIVPVEGQRGEVIQVPDEDAIDQDSHRVSAFLSARALGL